MSPKPQQGIPTVYVLPQTSAAVKKQKQTTNYLSFFVCLLVVGELGLRPLHYSPQQMLATSTQDNDESNQPSSL